MNRALLFLVAVLVALAAPSVLWAHGQTEVIGAGQVMGVGLGEPRGYLGVSLSEVDANAAQRLGLRQERGALVTHVVAEGPAAKAGLQKDDVVVSWQGVPVESAAQLHRHVRETPSGRSVRIGIVRAGREMNFDLTLGSRSDGLRDRARRQVRVMPRRPRLGVGLQNLSPQLAEYFGLSGRSGALITSVVADSPAGKVGLKAGDVILAIGGEKVESSSDIGRALRKSEGQVEITVMRERVEQRFTVQLEKAQTSLLGPELELIGPMEKLIPLLELRVEPFLMPAPEIKLLQPLRRII